MDRRKVQVLPVLLLALTVSSANALKVPVQNSEEGLTQKIDGDNVGLHWNGLDYEYGMFDPSQHPEHHGKLKKNESESNKPDDQASSTPAMAMEKVTNETHGSQDDHWDYYDDTSYEDDYNDSDTWWIIPGHHPPPPSVPDIITIGQKKATTAVPSAAEKKAEVTEASSTQKVADPQPNSSKGKNGNSEADYSWESDSDEDDGGSDEETVPRTRVSGLPGDGDPDADKYLNPDRYEDQQTRHHLEDQLTRTWTVQHAESNQPCIMLRGDITLVVPVNPSWFNKDYVEISVPQDATASGSCHSLNDDYQEIKLRWNVSVPSQGKTYENSVYFAFATNWTSEYSEVKVPEDMYALVALTVVYYNGEIGNGKEGIMSHSVNDLVEYMTPLNQSMSCMKDTQLLVGQTQMTFKNLQLEAFRPDLETLTPGEFSRSVLCDTDEIYVFDAVMTYLIWFWIGALMVILIIFVVLLSLGWRRRRSTEGNDGFGYKILSA